MPDFNKGDFTQQGVAGHVNANLRLNEKRLVNIDLTSNEEAEGCTITGTVKDLLNDKVYNIGSGGGGGDTPAEVVYISGTFTPVYDSQAKMYIVTIEDPTVIAQSLNDHFILTVGNVTKNVIAAPDTAQIPGGLYRLEPETPEERGTLLGVMPLAVGSPTVIIAPGADPVFVELKQVVGTLDITITSDQTGSPLFYVQSKDDGTAWDKNLAVYQPDFETNITIPYCGVKRAYISITGSFSYQNAVNCRVEDFGSRQVITIFDNNASIDLTFIQ